VAKAQAPDYGRDLGKLEGAVAVLTRLTFAVIGFLTVIVAGGVALFVQINQVRSDLVTQINQVQSTLADRLSKLESSVAQVQTAQSNAAGSLSRIETRLAEASPVRQPVQLLALSTDELQLIASVLKFDQAFAYKGIGGLGDVITDAKLLDFPTEILAKIPVLKTMRYTFNAKGQILIVSLPEDRIVAVI
jgi:hypothetical protein